MAAKPQTSLSAMMEAELAKTQSAKSEVVQFTQPQAEPTTPNRAPVKASQEIEKVTVYLPKQVYRFIKQTALELDKRPHDLLMQGVDLMLAQHGKNLKNFEK